MFRTKGWVALQSLQEKGWGDWTISANHLRGFTNSNWISHAFDTWWQGDPIQIQTRSSFLNHWIVKTTIWVCWRNCFSAAHSSDMSSMVDISEHCRVDDARERPKLPNTRNSHSMFPSGCLRLPLKLALDRLLSDISYTFLSDDREGPWG